MYSLLQALCARPSLTRLTTGPSGEEPSSADRGGGSAVGTVSRPQAKDGGQQPATPAGRSRYEHALPHKKSHAGGIILFLVCVGGLYGFSVGDLPGLTTGIIVTAVICMIVYGLSHVTGSVGGTVATLFIGLFMIGLALPMTCGGGSSSRAKISSVKANMHAVQLGVEQYAGDNFGNYPDGVLDKGFKWDTYVPSQPKNPFNQSIAGSANMEPDVKTVGTKGGPVYAIAQTYAGTGRPGTMRYFSETSNHSTYGIIGYDKDGKIIKETSAANAANYVLHN